MRTPNEMMSLITNFAIHNDNIRLLGMEGSRTNKNINNDIFQDFDVTYFVDDISEFTKDDKWLDYFGNRLIMQKPEDMELFPAEEFGYSFLIIFEDYNKMDLTILNISDLTNYLTQDKLRTILIDKNNLCTNSITPSDSDYYIRKPSERSYDDCQNEFWMLSSYVVKGLCRNEILFAIDHLTLMRNQLFTMITWKIGFEQGYNFSVGKNFKFIDKYISVDLWQSILETYQCSSKETLCNAFLLCCKIFRTISKHNAVIYKYNYPSYDENMSRYISEYLKI